MNDSQKSKAIELLTELLKEDSSEADQAAICEELQELLPDPCWSNYIFWSNDYNNEDGSLNFEKFFDKVISYYNTDEYKRNKRVIELVNMLIKKDFSKVSELDIVKEMNKLSFDPNWANYIFVEKNYFDENGNLDEEKFIRKLFQI